MSMTNTRNVTPEQLAHIRKSSRNTNTASRKAKMRGGNRVTTYYGTGNVSGLVKSSFMPGEYTSAQLAKIRDVVLDYADRENEGNIPNSHEIRTIAGWVF